ncbi:hypothetical protein KEM60_01777 [Austwickia sp. TVS 96-490-7B]|nr:hypothetical protein [Austwickia sp. TVS 96-490-7B]
MVPAGLLRAWRPGTVQVNRYWWALIADELRARGVPFVSHGGDNGLVDPGYVRVLLDKMIWAEQLGVHEGGSKNDIWVNPASPPSRYGLYAARGGPHGLVFVELDSQCRSLAAALNGQVERMFAQARWDTHEVAQFGSHG